MCSAAAPASTSEALRTLQAGLAMVRSAAGFLAAAGAADLPADALAEGLRDLECADAAGAAARGVLLEAFDAQDASDQEDPDHAGAGQPCPPPARDALLADGS